MANYNAIARSNYFQVTDRDAFTAALQPYDVKITTSTSDPDRIALICEAEGGWPAWAIDDETDEDLELDLPALLAAHLVDGDVAVLMEAGAEKSRYVVGVAVAVNNRGDVKTIELEDIYALAAGLGTTVTRASW